MITSQIFTLLLMMAYLYLLCKAVLVAAREGQGVEVPLWMFAIVLLPFFGAAAALIHYDSKSPN